MGNEEPESRDKWRTARDKVRRKACYRIQQRIVNEEQCDEMYSEIKRHDIDPREILCHIIDGDQSYFSIKLIEKHYETLSRPFSTTHWWYHEKLVREGKLISWFGKEGIIPFREQIEAREECTWIEICIWLKRYRILGALLKGGIPPFTDDPSLGKLIARRFVVDVPAQLSCYIVDALYRRQEGAAHNHTCGVCRQARHVLKSPTCDHSVCERCTWQDILDNMDTREGNIVVCPLCDQRETTKNTASHQDSKRKGEESLEKFLQLPESSDIKDKRKTRQNRGPEKDIRCSTWDEALRNSLGRCQTYRKDRFFRNIENGSIPYVRAFLMNGIDLRATNEYGQTGLYLAVWRSNMDLVKMLLEFGSDPNIPENGGMTALAVAEQRGDELLLELLKTYGAKGSASAPLGHLSADRSSLNLVELIEEASPLEGTGSYYIDGSLSEESVRQLLHLHETLPKEDAPDKGGRPCSIRSYFCDTWNSISSVMLDTICDCMGRERSSVLVYPQMRFLCYSETGSFLAPHVDLTRAHPFTGARSSHTFLLYLTDCPVGGETVLLRSVKPAEDNVVKSVSPMRGRLLLFPHDCPHQGAPVVDVPKILIRGEVLLM